MKVKVENQPKSTVRLDITIPGADVKKVYEEVITEVAKTAEIPGFRKGKAPIEKVKDKTDKGKLNGEIINKLLQTYYPQALKENHVSPVSNPKVEIVSFGFGEEDGDDSGYEQDFNFYATVAVRPEVKVGDYRKAVKKKYEDKVKKVKKETKELNAEKLKKGEKIEEPHIHLTVDEVLDAVASTSDLEVADLLIEEETDRMVSRLVDQIQRLNLTVEQYLNAQNKTSEDLRKDYDVIAEKSIKSEFVMNKLVELEKIEVEDEEIEEMINSYPDEETRKLMQTPTERWYIKSVIAKNKILKSLIQEAEGENYHDH